MRKSGQALLLLLVPVLPILLSGCTSSETPTEPSSSATVHLVGQNASASTIGLHKWTGGETLVPVEVLPGSSVEFQRWHTVGQVHGATLFVFLPSTSGPFPFSLWAQVEYDLAIPSDARANALTVNVRVSIDPSGSLSATSDRPDVFQVVRVSYPGAR